MRTFRLFLLSTTLVLAASLAVLADGGPQQTSQDAQPGLRRFSGTPIDVDYQSANLRTVLRNLSEIGGINLVIDPSVPANASVDLKLSQVPWDQVMDVVLKSGQLTYELDGPVLRVLTRDARTKELQAEAEQKRASQAAPDLQMRRIKLNYSPAVDVKKLLEDAHIVSERGSVEVNERTNMVIIQDLPKNLADAEQIIAELDRPEPQVEIEAKILQTNRDTARALGVQWGVNGRVAPELGNTTGLAFPNRGTASGRVVTQGSVQQGPNDPRATPLDGRDQRRLRARLGTHGTRTRGQGQDSVDAARHHAEQQSRGSHAGV
jgi:type II secretory pathway component HofQ